MFTQMQLQQIADDLQQQGFSVQANAAPAKMCSALLQRFQYLYHRQGQDFTAAKIGRQQARHANEQVRSDRILWLQGEDASEQQYFAWLQQLQQYLNQQFYLGLSRVESHFAVYQAGDYYKKHVDAFKGQSNRKVSLVLYLNQQWKASDQGQLKLYPAAQKPITLPPTWASFVVFMSEEIPHEVLISQAPRYSIATWFRIDCE